MSIGNAIEFIKQGLGDKKLRNCLNRAASTAEIHRLLALENFKFSSEDFDQAYYLQLAKCQALEQAEQIKEFKLWWDMVLASMDPPDEN